MNSLNLDLTMIERENLQAFLNSRRVKKLLREGGAYAVVFESNTGIGIPVTAHARSKDFSVLLKKDITDYKSW
jgi:hypothetical protein